MGVHVCGGALMSGSSLFSLAGWSDNNFRRFFFQRESSVSRGARGAPRTVSRWLASARCTAFLQQVLRPFVEELSPHHMRKLCR